MVIFKKLSQVKAWSVMSVGVRRVCIRIRIYDALRVNDAGSRIANRYHLLASRDRTDAVGTIT